MSIKVLGIDPGSKNMGFGVVEAKVAGDFKYRILEVGMFKQTIKEMKGDVRGDLKRFKKELDRVIRAHKPDVIVAERYMNRGIRGNTGELVGLMLGVVALAPVEDVSFIPAAQWKNAVNRNGDLKELYDSSRLVAHVIDATSIAMYGATHYTDRPAFTFLQGKGFRRYLNALDKAKIR